MEFSIVQPNQLKHIQLVQAETGSALKYKHRDLLDQNVPSLQEYIEKQIHVPKVQQILLKSCGTQLELTKNLFETLPAGASLYIFNSRFYSKKSDSEPEQSQQLKLSLISEPKKLTPTKVNKLYGDFLHGFIDSNSKATFDKICEYHLQCKHNLKSASEILQMPYRQQEAEICAQNNLIKTIEAKSKQFDQGLSEIETRLNKIGRELENRDQYISKLREIKVDPSLASQGQKVLADYFDEKKISGSGQACHQSLRKILEKLSASKEAIDSYKSKVNALKTNIDQGTTFPVENFIKYHENSIKESFQKHIEDFKAVVEKAGGKPTSDQVYEFAKSQAELFETQAKKMQSEFEVITREIEAEITLNQGKMKEFIHEISRLQREISESMNSKLKSLDFLTNKLHENHAFVQVLKKFPDVYAACMAEVKRRTEFKANFTRLSNALDKYIEYENYCRERFLKENGRYIPSTFCPFLQKQFPKLNFKFVASNIEEDLPIHVVADMETEINKKLLEFSITFDKQHEIIQAKTAECKKLEEELKALRSKITQHTIANQSESKSTLDQFKLYEQSFPLIMKDKILKPFKEGIESRLWAYQEKFNQMEVLMKKLVQKFKRPPYFKNCEMNSDSEKIMTEVFTALISRLPESRHEEFWDKGISLASFKEIIGIVASANAAESNGEYAVKILAPQVNDRIMLQKTSQNHYTALAEYGEMVKVKYVLAKEGQLYVEENYKSSKFKVGTIKSILPAYEGKLYKKTGTKYPEVSICMLELENLEDLDIC